MRNTCRLHHVRGGVRCKQSRIHLFQVSDRRLGERSKCVGLVVVDQTDVAM